MDCTEIVRIFIYILLWLFLKSFFFLIKSYKTLCSIGPKSPCKQLSWVYLCFYYHLHYHWHIFTYFPQKLLYNDIKHCWNGPLMDRVYYFWDDQHGRQSQSFNLIGWVSIPFYNCELLSCNINQGLLDLRYKLNMNVRFIVRTTVDMKHYW